MVEFTLGVNALLWALVWFVAGLLASILVSVTSQLLTNIYYRPQLIIDNCRIVKRNGSEQIGLQVENQGRSAAENCAASIVFDDIDSEHVRATMPGEDSGPDIKPPIEGEIRIELPWKDSSATRCVNRDDIGTLDICRRIDNRVAIASEDGISSPSLLLTNDQGQYKATVRVTSSESASASTVLTLEPSPSQLDARIE